MARLRALAAHCSGNGHGVRGRWAIVNRMEIFGDTLMFGSVRSAPDDIDLGDLEVKTGQDAIFAISEVMERQRREVEERRAREEGRCSEPRREVAADGVVWEYVVVDDAFARITGCVLPDDGMRELVRCRQGAFRECCPPRSITGGLRSRRLAITTTLGPRLAPRLRAHGSGAAFRCG